jgi:hypothetical protein
MASTNAMLQKCSGLLETDEMNDWEHEFIESLWERSEQGKRPDLLTPKQVEKLEQVHKRYFA